MKKEKEKNNFKINSTNRFLYSILTIFIIIFGGILIYSTAPNPGHHYSDLDLGPIEISGNNVFFYNKTILNEMICLENSENCISDWSSGGSSKWSESGSNIYYNSGNVGIGTSSPSQKLHIGEGNINSARYSINGQPILRLNNKIGDFFVNVYAGPGYHWSSTGNYRTAIGFEPGRDSIGNYQTFVHYSGGSGGSNKHYQTVVGSNSHSRNIGEVSIGYKSGINSNNADYLISLGDNSGVNIDGHNSITIGYLAGRDSIGTSSILIGSYAGWKNQGNHPLFIGYQSGMENRGDHSIMVGGTRNYIWSDLFNYGDHLIALGYSAGYGNRGNYVVGIGYEAVWKNTGNNVVAIGYQAGKDNIHDNQFIVHQKNINAIPLIQGNFSSGHVGIGLTSPEYGLDLPNIAGNGGRGYANDWITYSSIRWKENINNLDRTDAVNKIMNLNPVSYDWKQDYGGSKSIGFIAEEVGKVIPEAVDFDDEGIFADGLSINPIVAYLVKFSQEQEKELQQLKKEIQ